MCTWTNHCLHHLLPRVNVTLDIILGTEDILISWFQGWQLLPASGKKRFFMVKTGLAKIVFAGKNRFKKRFFHGKNRAGKNTFCRQK